MATTGGLEEQSVQTVLAAIQRLTYVAVEHDQREFERIWGGAGSVIESQLSTKSSDLDSWLDALERYLLSGPAYGKHAAWIYRATTEELRRLECAYDVWNLLVQAGEMVYARGEDKIGRPWDTHERPITASSRWFVKARLAVNLNGTAGRIELFKLAAQESRKGDTRHCANRANHMEAFALHYSAFDLLRTATDEGAFEKAARLFELAHDLVETTDEEGDPNHAHLERFFRSLCMLQHAMVRMELRDARGALGDALKAARKLPSPQGPFRTPNPWTSLLDLENEERFIAMLGNLQAHGIESLESAIKELDDIIADCEVSERKEELTTRLLVLRGLMGARQKQRAELERYCALAAKSTERLRAGVRSKQLVECLRKTLSGSSAENVLSMVIPLLPLGLVGIGDPSSPTPLLYSAPSWLKELSKTSSPNEARTLLLWYVRLVLDYLWSVSERAARQEGRNLGQRPAFADLPYRRLSEQLEDICQLLQWKGAPAGELETLRASLLGLTTDLEAPPSDFVERVEVLIRGTQRWLFPVAVFFKVDDSGELGLWRVDVPSQDYRYQPGEVDAAAFDTWTVKAATAAYIKPRIGRMTGRPGERNHKPLVLYPAPVYPVFSRTCCIVEGPSDKVFFEGILDRVEPGWRALRSEADPTCQTIEIRVARGGDNVAKEYDSVIKQGVFYTQDTLLEAGAQRIVVVVDKDKREVLLSKSVSLCKHRCSLDPDLERIAPTAFQAALEAALRRSLDLDDLAELNKRFDSQGNDFAKWVQGRWGIQLKRGDSGLAESFAVLLARVFPERQDGAPWNAIWDICDRVLQLAKGPRRLKPLVIGLPSTAQGLSGSPAL